MPICYLDSSALLKRYIPEQGSQWLIALVEREPVAISVLTFAEVASALGRRRREGRLSQEEQEAIWGQFRADAESHEISALTRFAMQRAAEILFDPSAPRLRALDALHVASVRTVFDRALRRGESIGAFISADRALNEAARWAGLRTENPEDHP